MDFISIKIIDTIDVLLVAILAYQVYKIIKGTVAMNIFVIIIVLYIVWFLCRALKMDLLSLIIGQVMGVGVIALIIVFQPEIRRFLLHLGNRSKSMLLINKVFFHSQKVMKSHKSIDELIIACREMSELKIGALIVIARQSPLSLYAETGDIIDANITSRLIESIFFKNNPLHDGAMIIRGERIYAARCVLPSTENQNLPAHCGMRHRAAIGVTEHTDSFVIVVSEETGSISIVDNGKLQYNISITELKNIVFKNI